MKRILNLHSLIKNKTFHLVFLSVVTIVLALILIAGLFNFANLKLSVLFEAIRNFPLWGLSLVFCMILLNIAIGSYKWKLVVEYISTNETTRPEYFFYYSNTALGAFLGLFMPVQVSTLVVRSISMRVGGYSSIGKGALTSLISQFQDVIIILFFFLPGILTLLFGISEAVWLTSVIVFLIGGYIFFKYFAKRMLDRISSIKTQNSISPSLRLKIINIMIDLLQEASNKDLLNPCLTIPLYFLSLLRFINLASRSILISWLIGLDISPIIIISISSIVQLSLLIAITPGNLGFVEWGWVGLLSMTGVLTSDAGQFALISRFLGYGSTILIFLGVSCILLIKKGHKDTEF